MIDDALGWVQETGLESPVYVWLHLYDAHIHIRAPKQYTDLLPGQPYDAEIAYVDDQVQRVVDAFEGTPTLLLLLGTMGRV